MPIPGTKRVKSLEDNAGAVGIRLTNNDVCELDVLEANVACERYGESMMAMIEA